MKRIAVLSDIHSNAYALQAVLADAKTKKVDRFINLGDIFYGPILPKKTYELLQTVNFLTVSGNQDRQVYESTEEEIQENPTMHLVREELNESILNWIKKLPDKAVIEETFFLCHGAPDDDMRYLLEDVADGIPKIKNESDILDLLAEVDYPVILCGHSHIPRVVSLSTGQLIINPGSVGLPAYEDDLPVKHRMENFTSHASYAIIEKKEQGWNAEFIKVAYPFQKAAELARGRGRDDWWFYLSTGKVK